MKKLFGLLLATSAVLNACGGDDDSTTPGAGGTSMAGKAGSSSAGKGGSAAAGKGGSSSAGKGGSGGSGGTAGKGSSSAGKGSSVGGTSTTGGAAGEGGAAAGQAGASGGESGSTSGGGAGGDASSARTFTVTLENVAKTKLFTSSGVFNTPMGDSSAGPATPGKKYEFTIDAGRKQKLSFATMLAATNDLFFGPDGSGIALYDGDGNPITADVTSQIHLWDAGTEVNEEPHVGANTVTHQSAPDTGTAENGNVVDIADATDGVAFDYPAVADVLTVTVTHMTGTEFKVSIEDISAADALQTTDGDFPVPLSPGVWVVHNGTDPLFTVGMPDRGQGLEHIAEDGNPTALGAFASDSDNVGLTFPASPGVWVVHSAGTKPLFTTGDADYGDGIEHIAEDGNPTALGGNLGSLSGELAGAVFNTPVGASSPGAILPGSKYQFSFDASPGDALSFATMLAATDDVFFAPGDTGIALFDGGGHALGGDVTSQIMLWDAGTEGNEEPGIGPNTVTNQLAADTGTPGEGLVQLLSDDDDGFTYPAVNTVLKVTVSHD